MNYTKEAREVTQSMYGGYCNICRELNLTLDKIVPYHKFTIEEYNKVLKLFKENRGWKTITNMDRKEEFENYDPC